MAGLLLTFLGWLFLIINSIKDDEKILGMSFGFTISALIIYLFEYFKP